MKAIRSLIPPIPDANATCHLGICPQSACANCQRIEAAHIELAFIKRMQEAFMDAFGIIDPKEAYSIGYFAAYDGSASQEELEKDPRWLKRRDQNLEVD